VPPIGGAALWQPRFACLVRISVYEHVCRRRKSLNLRQADSLVLSVFVGALGIDFCGVVTVFIDVLGPVSVLASSAMEAAMFAGPLCAPSHA